MSNRVRKRLLLQIAMISSLILCLMMTAIFPMLNLPKTYAATTSTWTGGGADNNWSTSANWSGGAVPCNDGTCELVFGSSSRLNPLVNYNNPWHIGKITFIWEASSSYSLSGNPLSIAEGIASQDSGAGAHTINNNLTFTSSSPYISPGYDKKLTFGGVINSTSPLLVKGQGPSVTEISVSGSMSSGMVEVNAATSLYGDITLQLDHAMSLNDSMTLKLTPSADGTKKAKVNLNFGSGQSETVAQLFLNGIQQPAGTYSAATHPDYFSGSGSLQVGSGGGSPTTSTWTGGGADNNWSTPGNWSGNTVPCNDGTCEIVFGSSNRLSPAVNANNPWNVGKITFIWEASGSYSLSGNALSVADGVESHDSGASAHTINNAIAFTSASPYISPGYNKKLSFGGVLSSSVPLIIKGHGPSVTEVASGGQITAETVEVSATNSLYGDITLQLDHAASLNDSTILKLSPSADGTKKAKVNLNFAASQSETVAQLYLNGVLQQAGTYNATTHPDYFSGSGSLQVGSGGGGDTTAPAAVTNLAVNPTTSGTASLTWTAPGDDGNTGTAASYDIRYSASPITEANWASVSQASGEPAPAAAGTNQSFTVEGLVSGATYYFALRTSDEVFNQSGLSNVPSATTASVNPVLLELGSSPDRLNDPNYTVYTGALTWTEGADSSYEEADDWVVAHAGFGSWKALFSWNTPNISPRFYKFKAKYRSGGEVGQVTQTWSIFSQPTSGWNYRHGTTTLNMTPWEYQVTEGSGRILVLPGDAQIGILNEGKADGAKIFDDFELIPDEAVPSWMNSSNAQYRAGFIGRTDPFKEVADKYIFVVDGNTASDQTLFAGLDDPQAASFYGTAKAVYLLGTEADQFADALNIASRPAAVITDANFKVLGALSNPPNVQKVIDFLNDPATHGSMPSLPVVSQPPATALSNGVPAQWLIGGINGGKAGLEIYGLDSDKKLRPNPGNRYTQTNVVNDIGVGLWTNVIPQSGGKTTIVATTPDNTWAKQTGYAQIYLYAASLTSAVLHLEHNGIESFAWLDETPLNLANDPSVPSEFPALPSGSEMPKAASITISPGWHSLKIKMINALPENQEFFFAAKFTNSSGVSLTSIQTKTSDPSADLSLNAMAAKLMPSLTVNAPGNIPHPGDAITVTADMNWHPMEYTEKTLSIPILSFPAALRLTMTDYDGNVLAEQQVSGTFPSEVNVNFGTAPPAGYYAIRSELYTADGQLIAVYPADGFTVVGGTTNQKMRLGSKKIWNNYYYAFTDTNPTDNWDFIANWIERTGIYQTMGSNQMVTADDLVKWQNAASRGLNVFADFGGDSSWINDNQADTQNYVNQVNSYTRFYKSINELDIRRDSAFQAVRDPAHWTARTQWEYQTVKADNPNALYVGASFVRPGDMNDSGYPANLGPGNWFKQTLQNGIDQYVDAWDVHAYPQIAPNLDSIFGNSPVEDALGVEAAYAALGRINTKPFFYGEVGAISNHGQTGVRWQAEATAKMVAWVNSRSNYLGIAFIISQENAIDRGRQWGYSMGRRPGEAALATASALIDGLPYTAASSGDSDVDLARFGNTFMAWKRTDGSRSWTIHLPGAGPWVIVDVVGNKKSLAVNGNNDATIQITPSPVYVLTQTEYNKLTN